MKIKEFLWEHADNIAALGGVLFVLLLVGTAFYFDILLGVFAVALALLFGGGFIGITRPYDYKRRDRD